MSSPFRNKAFATRLFVVCLRQFDWRLRSHVMCAASEQILNGYSISSGSLRASEPNNNVTIAIALLSRNIWFYFFFTIETIL